MQRWSPICFAVEPGAAVVGVASVIDGDTIEGKARAGSTGMGARAILLALR
jgi:hypothetical protein